MLVALLSAAAILWPGVSNADVPDDVGTVGIYLALSELPSAAASPYLEESCTEEQLEAFWSDAAA